MVTHLLGYYQARLRGGTITFVENLFFFPQSEEKIGKNIMFFSGWLVLSKVQSHPPEYNIKHPHSMVPNKCKSPTQPWFVEGCLMGEGVGSDELLGPAPCPQRHRNSLVITG